MGNPFTEKAQKPTAAALGRARGRTHRHWQAILEQTHRDRPG